jgi:hypothetical protein
MIQDALCRGYERLVESLALSGTKEYNVFTDA